MSLRAAVSNVKALLLSLSVLAGCGKIDRLPGAIGQIPIYNPAELVDTRSSFSGDNGGDPFRFSSYTWELTTESSADEVIAYYSAQWPQAGRTENREENTVRLRNPAFPPEGTPLDEGVLVTVWRDRQGGKTKYTISEDVLRVRRP